MDNKTSSFFYRNQSYHFSFPLQSIEKLLTPKAIDALLTEEDVAKLVPLLPFQVDKSKLIEILFSKSKFFSPISLFKQMAEINYFDESNQTKLNGYYALCLESYIEERKRTYKKLKAVYPSFIKKITNTGDISENEISDGDSVISTHSELASPGYSSQLSDELSAYSVDLKDKQDAASEGEQSNMQHRFNSIKTGKNGLTIMPRSEEEVVEFQEQEIKRYETPYLPYVYYNSRTKQESITAPCIKKSQLSAVSKPREHIMLKSERPPFIYNLCLVRDAASRLPDGIGTRADIYELVRDSNYVNLNVNSHSLNSIVSGALDRLHYEKDPCVKYDQQRKLWVYLHKDRKLDCPEWVEFNDGDEKSTGKKKNKVN